MPKKMAASADRTAALGLCSLVNEEFYRPEISRGLACHEHYTEQERSTKYCVLGIKNFVPYRERLIMYS
jgi:hypothetical protein